MRGALASALVAVAVTAAAPCFADGGRVVLYGPAGPFLVTVFSAPSPLRAGRVELSVLVQDLDTQAPRLDAEVEIALVRPGEELREGATHAEAANRWLYVAWFEVDGEGRRELEVDVRSQGGHGTARSSLEVGPPLPPLLGQWPLLGLPFLLVGVYALHQWRRAVSRRAFPRSSRLPL